MPVQINKGVLLTIGRAVGSICIGLTREGYDYFLEGHEDSEPRSCEIVYIDNDRVRIDLYSDRGHKDDPARQLVREARSANSAFKYVAHVPYKKAPFISVRGKVERMGRMKLSRRNVVQAGNGAVLSFVVQLPPSHFVKHWHPSPMRQQAFLLEAPEPTKIQEASGMREPGIIIEPVATSQRRDLRAETPPSHVMPSSVANAAQIALEAGLTIRLRGGHLVIVPD